MDIPVNAVATALKDFFSKRLPPLFEEDIMSELEDIAGMYSYFVSIPIGFRLLFSLIFYLFTGTRGIKPLSASLEVKTDRSCRLLALRTMLTKLPQSNFQVLKFIFQHFVRYANLLF